VATAYMKRGAADIDSEQARLLHQTGFRFRDSAIDVGLPQPKKNVVQEDIELDVEPEKQDIVRMTWLRG